LRVTGPITVGLTDVESVTVAEVMAHPRRTGIRGRGASTSRIPLTRVVVGGAVAGGLGAVVGGSSRRDTIKYFLTLSTSVGTVVIPYDPASETKARKFAAQINAAGRVL